MIRRSVVLLLVVLAGCTAPVPPPPLTGDHRRAVEERLAAKGLDVPSRLELGEGGFLIAEYEVREEDLSDRVPLSAKASVRLLAIREALQPYGYADYRVNLNGPATGRGER